MISRMEFQIKKKVRSCLRLGDESTLQKMASCLNNTSRIPESQFTDCGQPLTAF